MGLLDLLLVLCLIGGICGVIVGASRRSVSDAMAGLIVVAAATYGLLH
jgi:hypothetical protein